MRKLLILFFLFSAVHTIAQENENILEKIRLTNSILESYRKSENASVYELRLLNNKLNEQKKLVDQLDRDIESLDAAINNINDSLSVLRDRYNTLREEYKQMVLFAYLNKDRYQPFLFIFSSGSFNEAFKRFLYIKNYSSRRKRYIRLIKNAADDLAAQEEILKKRKEKKQYLVTEQRKHLNAIRREYKKKEKLLAELRKKEEEVRSKLKNQVKLAKELDKKISASILNNLAPNETGEETDMDFADSNFSQNKGELPWPVDEGVLLSSYGKKNHPFLKNVTITNHGIDISTLANSPVKAVYEGRVVKVVKIPGINYSILLKHGTYYTLYSNLKDLNIEQGDYVLRGDVLGKVDFDFQNEEQYYIKFQVWHKSDRLNPLAWLKKK